MECNGVARPVGIFMTQSAFLETRQQLRNDFEIAVMQALTDEAVPRDAGYRARLSITHSNQ